MTKEIKSAAILRQKAEEMLQKKVSETGSQLSDKDIITFIHELEVHQVELELQNEELRLAQTAEQAATEKYRELYDFAPSGYFTLSREGEIIDLNFSGSQMLGKERSLLINERVGFFVSDDAKPIFNSFLENIFNCNAKVTSEVTFSVSEGLIMYVHLSGISDQNGEYCLVNMVDISELKRTDAELILKNEQLLKLDAEKNKFFSIIAHDLRGPFSSFLGLTQLMTEVLPTLSMTEIQEIAVSMRNSAANLFGLLENLLSWTRMHQGLIPFNPQVVQLFPIVENSISVGLEPAKNKGIEIAYNIPDGMEVYADSNILQTVIRNLVSNAVKFTHKGGKIILSAKKIQDKNVEISISDTGIGMSREMVENLFHPIVQTIRKGTEGEPSTGLGMILCKEFVEKHGGRIWVESEVGKGSDFKFTLPMNRDYEKETVNI